MDVSAQDPKTNTTTQSYADAYQPPGQPVADMPTPTPPQSVAQPTKPNESEELERQNIFDMLGVSDGTTEQKEEFLDELQHVIWEDFIEHDVPLLVTSGEATQLAEIKAKEYATDLEQQEAIVVFLEKLIPDMEDIMLEKALELKADLFKERMLSEREDGPQHAAKIDTAETAMKAGNWKTAADILNAL